MRYQTDPVDFACESWAQQWIDHFARLPVKGSQVVGRVGSTLDLIKLMGDGAGSSGWVTQIYPEVFLGDGLVIACALKCMVSRDRGMLWHHYVDRWFYARIAAVNTADGREVYEHTTLVAHRHPDSGNVTTVAAVDRTRPVVQVVIERRVRPIKQQIMAQRLGISRAEYHLRRDRVRAYLRGILDAPKCLDTKVGHETPAEV